MSEDRKPYMHPALGAPYEAKKLPTINGEPVDIYQKIADESMAISGAMKEDLASDKYDDTPMAISSSMKEDIARDSDDDRPLFGRNWDE